MNTVKCRVHDAPVLRDDEVSKVRGIAVNEASFFERDIYVDPSLRPCEDDIQI